MTLLADDQPGRPERESGRRQRSGCIYKYIYMYIYVYLYLHTKHQRAILIQHAHTGTCVEFMGILI